MKKDRTLEKVILFSEYPDEHAAIIGFLENKGVRVIEAKTEEKARYYMVDMRERSEEYDRFKTHIFLDSNFPGAEFIRKELQDEPGFQDLRTKPTIIRQYNPIDVINAIENKYYTSK